MNYCSQLIYLILLVVFSSSCDQSKLAEGHWHIHNVENPEMRYLVLDVSKDSTASLCNYSIDGVHEGFHDRKNNILYLPGDCGSAIFEYCILNDDLFLHNEYWNFIGKRCGKGCCTALSDFENSLEVDLDLPVANNQCDSLEPFPHQIRSQIVQTLIISKRSAESIPLTDSSQHSLRFEYNFLALNKIKYLDNRLTLANKHIITRLIADRDLPVKELNLIYQELQKRGFWKFMIACRTNLDDWPNELMEYVFLRKLELDAAGTIEDQIY